ncbi:MAG: hypothetical protein WAU41_11740, partial [Gaiellaceae bacterium]
MGQIDLRSMSLGHRILLGGGVILFIVMFFTWQGVSLLGTTVGVSGWHGLNGILLGLATLALIVWEVALLLGDQMAELRKNVPLAENLVSAGLAGGVLVLMILKFLTANELRRWPEWVGLVVAIGIGYGGWLVYST